MLRNKKVLIIEDEKNLRDALSKILRIKRYQVFEAADGEDGLEKIITIEPDIILCDINMPKMDGFEVLRKINNLKYGTVPPPVIFLTANVKREDVRHGMNLGAVDYITKPFSMNEVVESIESKLTHYIKLKESGVQDERKRISLELHSNIQQLLVAAKLNLDSINVLDSEKQALLNSNELIVEAIKKARSISHKLAGLNPEKQDLEKNISRIAQQIKLSGRVKFNFHYNVNMALGLQLEHLIFRWCQELVNNSLKHANANQLYLKIETSFSENQLLLIEYRDNGVGFDPKKVKFGFGLSNLFDKINDIGGEIDLVTSDEDGTMFKIQIPFGKNEAIKSRDLLI